MDRIDKLINHESFIAEMNKIATHERNREFCKHSIEHSLDVARIAYIINLENNMQIQKEIIYAAALLHDIGRGIQYSEAIPHHEASINISGKILDDLGFIEKEKNQILNAIYYHSDSVSKKQSYTTYSDNVEISMKDIDQKIDNSLCDLLYKADKLSRACFRCSAYEECNWVISKKNNKIIY